jgi:hypothetical protein
MILSTLLTLILSAAVPAAVQDTLEAVDNTSDNHRKAAVASDQGYWKKKKYNRISYNNTLFSPLFVDDPYPVSMSFGLDCGRNIYLHKKPIAGFIKFGLDVGMDINYTRFDIEEDYSDYEGPSGYTGSAYYESDDDTDTLLKLSGNRASIGLAVGPSVTLNPVGKLRLCGYFHVVPTGSLYAQGIGAFAGYSTMMKYGLELSYGFIGIGVEHESGMDACADLVSYYMTKSLEGDPSSIGKSRYFSESLQVYLSFRFGKK